MKVLQPSYTNPYILETFLNRVLQFIDQDLRKTSSPIFRNLTITDSLNYGGVINRSNQDISDFQDTILLLNSGNDTTQFPLSRAGLEIFRGDNIDNAYLLYDNISSAWITGVENGIKNLIVTTSFPSTASAGDGNFLIFNAATKSFTVTNQFQNAVTFSKSTTYNVGANAIFSDLTSSVQWADSVAIGRSLLSNPSFQEPPIEIQNAGLLLSDMNASLVITSTKAQILLGNFNGPCLGIDPSTSALIVSNLSSNMGSNPSLLLTATNDATSLSGPPNVSFRNNGAMMLNRSLYFGPKDNPSPSASATYQVFSPSAADPSNTLLSIKNVLNTVEHELPSILSLDGLSSQLRLSFGDSGYGFIQSSTEDTGGLVLSSQDVSGNASYPITLVSSAGISLSGPTNASNDLAVQGHLIQQNGIQNCSITVCDDLNTDQNAQPSVISSVLSSPSVGWHQLYATIQFKPMYDNESTVFNITLPEMNTAGLQDYGHLFCQILTAWRLPTTDNMIPLEGVHVLPLLGRNKVQVYFMAETNETHYITLSVLYQING